ncbi:MAG: hypothetical protein PHR72_07810, partial [Synergistales bacterium]|nr:hypothetical protein [Synergistales bacterium]
MRSKKQGQMRKKQTLMQKIQKPEAINASGFFACHPGSATLWMKDPGLDPGLKRSLTPLLCG